MTSELARIGRAIGSPTRAAMIDLLFDGAPHTAGELAATADVTSGTASQHLAVLVDAGIVTVSERGRHRYFRMTNSRIAHALEQLGGVDLPPVTSLRLSREQRRVRAARTCYDHLAGQLGTALADRFVTAGWVDPVMSTLTPAGTTAAGTHFSFDPDTSVPPRSRRPLIRPCRDWTEERDHLAGVIGAFIADVAMSRDWVVRQQGSRALTITDDGRAAFGRMGVAIDA